MLLRNRTFASANTTPKASQVMYARNSGRSVPLWHDDETRGKARMQF